MDLFKNIKHGELPALLHSSYMENSQDLQKTSRDLETIDIMLGVMKMKSLIGSRDRRAKSRWSKGRNLHKIMENIITRPK